jgi:phage gp45-like
MNVERSAVVTDLTVESENIGTVAGNEIVIMRPRDTATVTGTVNVSVSENTAVVVVTRSMR